MAAPAASRARTLAAAGALLALVYAAASTWNLARQGYPWAAAVEALVNVPLVAYFVAALAWPHALAEALSFRAPFRPERPGHLAAGALVLFTLLNTVGRALVTLVWRAEGAALQVPETAASILASTLVLAALSLASAWAWAHFVEGAADLREVGRALLLTGGRQGQGRLAAWGIALGAVSVVLGIVLSLAWAAFAEALGLPPPGDEVARTIAERLGLAGIVAATALAAFHEEVFFRGLLAPRVGLWLQALLFGVGHASYGTALQVLAPFALGLLWGWAALRWRSVWLTVVAHGAFNLFGFLLAGEYLPGA